MTTYLRFQNSEEALAALDAAGIAVEDGNVLHQNVYFAGQGGVIWKVVGDECEVIPGIHVNVECECPDALCDYIVPAPATPFTVRS